MKVSATGVPLGALICLMVAGSAEAANRKAQQMVAGSTKDQAELLAKFPALMHVDKAIRADCAAKIEAKLATEEFCGCAAAVTLSLWRSGADPKMIPRLNEYLKNPTEAGATLFLQYQGPELYRPICKEATKR
jgi:hypothetical protein